MIDLPLISTSQSLPAQRFTEFAEMLQKLGLHSFAAAVILVGGTNGKGSTIACLEAVYLAAGFRVGTFTSPHLFTVNERIRIQGESVTDPQLIALLSQANILWPTPSSYFALITLCALLHFQQANLDVILLEVGLGGKYDPVNAVTSNISAVMTIDLDHEAELGNTRLAIAREKGGIFRANTPCVLGCTEPPEIWLQELQESQIFPSRLGKDFAYTEQENTWTWYGHDKVWAELPKPAIHLDNAAAALQMIATLWPRFPFKQSALYRGLKTLRVFGRQTKILYQHCKILLDVAHNPQSCAQLASHLQQQRVSGQRVFALCAFLIDKKVVDCLKPLIGLVDEWLVTETPSARALSVVGLQNVLESLLNKSIIGQKDPMLAFNYLLERIREEDILLIFGSFSLIAALPFLKKYV